MVMGSKSFGRGISYCSAHQCAAPRLLIFGVKSKRLHLKNDASCVAESRPLPARVRPIIKHIGAGKRWRGSVRLSVD